MSQGQLLTEDEELGNKGEAEIVEKIGCPRYWCYKVSSTEMSTLCIFDVATSVR